MNVPSGQIVNRSTLLKEVDTDSPAGIGAGVCANGKSVGLESL
jgi:hypothetical protein